MNRKYHPWSAEEIARLRELRETGMPFDEIGRILGRTRDGCITRAHLSGIFKHPEWARGKIKEPTSENYKAPSSKTREGATMIQCLCCKAKFRSEGPHNRLCSSCRGQSLTSFDSPARIGR